MTTHAQHNDSDGVTFASGSHRSDGNAMEKDIS